MNVTCPVVVSSSPRNSAARQHSSSNVGLLYSPFRGFPPTAPARSLNSSLLSHRHRRHISSKKVLVVRARNSAFDSNGDRGFVQRRFSRERDDPASKFFGVSWVSDGRAPQKQQDKASWAESRDFWSSANLHASSGSSSGNSSSPNNQQRSFSPSQTLLTNSNLTRKQQTGVINPSARLQNRLPAFKQAAEPDAFGASFSRVHGADAFSSFNGQSPYSSGALTQKPSSLEEGNSRNESVFTSKLEEILNKFRTRDKRRDDPYEEGRRNGAAPSALQSDEIHNEEFQATRSKVNRLQANGDWRTSRKDVQNPRHKGSVYETSVKDNDFNEEENVFSKASAERHLRGSRKEKRLGMQKGNAGGLCKTEGAPAPTNLSGSSTSLSSGSSMGAKNGSPVSTRNGKIATWHSHSNPSLPFEFQYSYSETPKAPIIHYREAPYSPFGPDTMGRPWTGLPPLNKSKKNRPEFDSFKPPPAGKKGIKFVQSPGPFPEGQGPTPARSREEILGEPLAAEEIVELVDQCRSERRQLNLGRDGLTHNMLDLIHCHWKRRRVVKVKSMGVPTVDMDNVCFHLEDKTGGKIIYRTGGVVYLFRGRNYNYKDRPEIPIMLWKPISPVYPRLIKRAVEGLTIEEADKLRLLGQKVEPLCTLAKNGVYLTLVKDVRAAFRIDKLVRIDCRGLNPSDYKKIGAKLRDLVPCVLLSFDDEQILMWKGKAMVSADVDADTSEATNGSEVEAAKSSASCGVGPADLSTVDTAVKVLADDAEDESHSAIEKIKQQALVIDNTGFATERSECSISAGAEGWSDLSTATGSTNQIRIPQLFKSEVNSSLQTVLAVEDDIISDKADLMPIHTKPDDRTFDIMPGHEKESNAASDSQFSESRRFMESNSMTEDQEDERMVPKTALKLDEYSTKLESSRDVGADKEVINDARVVRVDALWDQAIASGIAIQLDEIDTDSDVVVKKATELNEAVPAVGEYTRKLQSKLRVRKATTPRPDDDLRLHFANLYKAKIQKKAKKWAFRLPAADVPDSGGLPVDELARLLSIK